MSSAATSAKRARGRQEMNEKPVAESARFLSSLPGRARSTQLQLRDRLSCTTAPLHHNRSTPIAHRATTLRSTAAVCGMSQIALLQSPHLAAAPVELPPSPPLSSPSDDVSPEVARILDAVRKLHRGRDPDCPANGCYFLPRGLFPVLLGHIRADEDLHSFFHYKVRFDYDADRQQFILRMSSVLHDRFCDYLTTRIHAQLDRIALDNPDLAARIKGVRHGSFGRVHLDNGGNHELPSYRIPDCQFQYKGGHWPSLVVEVSWSQGRKDLSRLGYHYIRGSDANICAVVGFNLEYGPNGEAK